MIDFDGVIHTYDNGWQDGELYGKPIKGSKEAIDKLKDMGYEIVIFTTRASREINGPETDKLISNLEDYLKENEIHFDDITAEKLTAEFYIDDKGIRFENNWNEIMNKITK